MRRAVARLRKYANFPALHTPDEGEVVIVARSASGPWLRAAVVCVRRHSRGKIRVDFQWMEDHDHTVSGVPVRIGDKGHVYVSDTDAVPLIRRLPAPPPPRSGPPAGPEQSGDVTDARPPGSADPHPA